MLKDQAGDEESENACFFPCVSISLPASRPSHCQNVSWMADASHRHVAYGQKPPEKQPDPEGTTATPAKLEATETGKSEDKGTAATEA